jgi:hypothetical protein
MRFCHAVLAAALLSGCDLAQPAADGPPASLSGTWATGTVDVPFDTSFALVGDPTYASVEVDAVYHVDAELRLTDTDGDVRGNVHDQHYAEVEVGYVRHDGVVVRDEYTDDRLGSASNDVEAVYVAPTLTITSVASYMTEYVGLALDFSDGTAPMARRLTLPVRLGRLGERVVRVVRPGVATTFRKIEAG